jgi:hypothetical protein
MITRIGTITETVAMLSEVLQTSCELISFLMMITVYLILITNINWSHWLELQSISIVRTYTGNLQWAISSPTGWHRQVREADELRSNESSRSE